jgi:hypothetical protein
MGIYSSIKNYLKQRLTIEQRIRHCQQRLKNRVGDDRIKAGVR